MKQGIHPEYVTTTVVCACGSRIETKSTQGDEIHVEICSVCHPFYTGKQRLVDTAGRVERFKRKYGETGSGAPDDAGSEEAESSDAAEPSAEASDEATAEDEPAKQPAKIGAESDEDGESDEDSETEASEEEA